MITGLGIYPQSNINNTQKVGFANRAGAARNGANNLGEKFVPQRTTDDLDQQELNKKALEDFDKNPDLMERILFSWLIKSSGKS